MSSDDTVALVRRILADLAAKRIGKDACILRIHFTVNPQSLKACREELNQKTLALPADPATASMKKL